MDFCNSFTIQATSLEDPGSSRGNKTATHSLTKAMPRQPLFSESPVLYTSACYEERSKKEKTSEVSLGSEERSQHTKDSGLASTLVTLCIGPGQGRDTGDSWCGTNTYAAWTVYSGRSA